MFKRLLQLTGTRIADPDLTSSRTLGEVYGHLRDAAKPNPPSLFAKLHTEGQILREKAKAQITASDALSQQKKKADLGDLLVLGNVEMHRSRPTKKDERVKIGLEKVVEYALWERGLTTKEGKGGKKKRVHVPIGTPLSEKSTKFLVEKAAEAS